MNTKTDFDDRSTQRDKSKSNNLRRGLGTKNSNFAGGEISARTGGDKLPVELLQRLASGQKAIIDKKEMRKLTKTNYENLPEVRQRKEDAKKREELAAKKQKYQNQ